MQLPSQAHTHLHILYAFCLFFKSTNQFIHRLRVQDRLRLQLLTHTHTRTHARTHTHTHTRLNYRVGDCTHNHRLNENLAFHYLCLHTACYLQLPESSLCFCRCTTPVHLLSHRCLGRKVRMKGRRWSLSGSLCTPI